MKRHLRARLNKKNKLQAIGRVRPMLLALFVISIGIITNSDWWKVGVVLLISLFIGGYYRYRTPH